MNYVDQNQVKFGTVEQFKSGRGQGTGYGFVRGSGRNAGKAFFHINARTGVKVETWLGRDVDAHVETTWDHGSREPKAGDELAILGLEHDPKGLKASAWCFAEEYRKVVAECQERNAERVRRASAKERLEADIARAGWPPLSLVSSAGHEGVELLGGRYHSHLVAKKDGHSNTVGAVLRQTVEREGVSVERKTELPSGVRYIDQTYSMNPPKPTYLYIERAEAVAETEALLGRSFEEWGIATEFPPQVLYALGGRAQDLAVDVEAGKASYRLVSPRFGEQTVDVSFYPEKGYVDSHQSSFVNRAYLSGFIAPEVRDELVVAFAPAAQASRKPLAEYQARREVAVLESLRKGWSERRGTDAPATARILELLEEGKDLEYTSYRSYNSGWDQAIHFGPHPQSEREYVRLGRAEQETLHALSEAYRGEQTEAGRSVFSSGLLELDRSNPRYQAALRQAVAARILADLEDLHRWYEKPMEQAVDFSTHGARAMMEEWYAEELPQDLPEELSARLSELRAWWYSLEEVPATLEATLARHGEVAAREAEEAQVLVVSAEEAVASLREEYGSEVRLSGFCSEEFFSARYDLDKARYADVKASVQKILEACAKRRTELEARRADQVRAEAQKLAAEQARDEVLEGLVALANSYYDGANDFARATDAERNRAVELEYALANAFAKRQYETTLEEAKAARKLIAAVRARLARATGTTAAKASAPAHEDGQMEEAGNRHFRCLTAGCGRMEKVGKSDWQAYQSGQLLTISCTSCGKSATVKK